VPQNTQGTGQFANERADDEQAPKPETLNLSLFVGGKKLDK
jgi:hypothetical protein